MADDGHIIDDRTVALGKGGSNCRLIKCGDIIGDNYKIKSLIGAGGMGFVFRAEHRVLRKDFALKVLSSTEATAVDWLRFQSEGKAIARLDHANIVKIYNMGVDGGDCPYYVMDLLDGMSLADCLSDKTPLSLSELSNIFSQIASGLAYAHNRSIIHRDVKPSNVMLVDSGNQYPQVKIVDFGIAKVLDTANLQVQHQTAVGEIFGSPLYMSPEQCLGGAVDKRSDIYSLGCTLFETLCHRPPFQGDNAMETVLMHVKEPVPLLQDCCETEWGEDVERLVAKMLMKRPQDRYQTMEQVLHDLERVKIHKSVGLNTYTGYDALVQDRLEKIDSNFESELAEAPLQRKILRVTLGTVLFFSCVVVIASNFLAFKPLAKESKASSNFSHVSIDEINNGKHSQAAFETPLGKTLESLPAIKRLVNPVTGKQTFEFPDFALGRLVWPRGVRSISGFDPDMLDDGQAEAKGVTIVPAGVRLSFVLNQVQNSDAWRHPSFLSKFGPDWMRGVCLFGQVEYLDALGSSFDKDAEDANVAAIVKAATSWSNLQVVFFHGCAVDRKILSLLDGVTTLQELSLEGHFIRGKDVAARPYLKRLSRLLLDSVDGVDDLLLGLEGSTAIKDLTLRNEDCSAVGIKALAKCSSLTDLRIEKCNVDDDFIEAVSHIKSLRSLSFIYCHLKVSQIPLLARFKNLDVLTVNVPEWSEAERMQLQSVLPRVFFYGRNGKRLRLI